MKKKKLTKLLTESNKELEMASIEINRLNYVKNITDKDIQDLRGELVSKEKILQHAESALNYKEIRENDNAGFTAKIISNIVREG